MMLMANDKSSANQELEVLNLDKDDAKIGMPTEASCVCHKI